MYAYAVGSTGATNLINLNTPSVISLLIGTVLPLLVGYVTKQTLNSGIKAGILAGFSAISSVLTQWLDALNNNQHFLWQQVVIGALVTWVTGELTYLKLWKPSGVAAIAQNNGNTTNYDLNYPADTPTVDATDIPGADPSVITTGSATITASNDLGAEAPVVTYTPQPAPETIDPDHKPAHEAP